MDRKLLHEIVNAHGRPQANKAIPPPRPPPQTDKGKGPPPPPPLPVSKKNQNKSDSSPYLALQPLLESRYYDR